MIRDACKLANIPYPKSHTIDWEDAAVWNDILRSPVGIFQFENSDFAFNSLKRFKPRNIPEMSLVTAAIRPGGASYRERLFNRVQNQNPSPIIDDLLKDNLGYLCYQCDTINFLQRVCGLPGSTSETIRRGIAHKNKELLDKAMPTILDGYCSKSDKPRTIAELEAKEFLQIIEDSSKYQFGYNHSIGYCMIGYMCAYLRYYYPHEFITAYLNNAANEDDLSAGCSLAKEYGIKMLPPQFGLSTDEYVFDKEKNVIAMGVSSIKYLNKSAARQLYQLGKKEYTSFIDLLYEISNSTGVDARKLDVLIKIGYFSKFGKISTLLSIVEAFDYFKQGDAKKVKKDSDCPYMSSVKKFSTDIGKNGKEGKNYNITDCRALLLDIEREIIEADIPDIPWAERVKWQVEFTGSILHSGNEKDRWFVFIKDIYPACRKVDNKQFGYNVVLQSLGSGKQSKMTVFNKDFNRCPFGKGDIIKIRNPGGWERKGQYFNLTGYDLIG